MPLAARVGLYHYKGVCKIEMVDDEYILCYRRNHKGELELCGKGELIKVTEIVFDEEVDKWEQEDGWYFRTPVGVEVRSSKAIVFRL